VLVYQGRGIDTLDIEPCIKARDPADGVDCDGAVGRISVSSSVVDDGAYDRLSGLFERNGRFLANHHINDVAGHVANCLADGSAGEVLDTAADEVADVIVLLVGAGEILVFVDDLVDRKQVRVRMRVSACRRRCE